ncbi:nuclear transport factor 2 family protein [Yinghuangia sp. ASG 101]|uniref:nuclear transport factor 2 family protein n=1 Tax=Yinghuangia sp. ASG 101 TaxID=2896848 RepID=UPI001E6474DB|nr:nuclear transport factor 2 family protein [Yinghuangia sp. ASG 101]UGQ11764.1 nuclear transport factor 2 family protein [Yinghuangia sp. ASG 101]
MNTGDTARDAREEKARISEVLIRYATGIDQRDWALFRTCWAEDVEADYGAFGRFTDADALTDRMARAHQGMGPTYHRITNIAVTLDPGGDLAHARSYVHAALMTDPDRPDSWLDVFGHFEDTLRRTDDGWRIVRRASRMARQVGHARG